MMWCLFRTVFALWSVNLSLAIHIRILSLLFQVVALGRTIYKPPTEWMPTNLQLFDRRITGDRHMQFMHVFTLTMVRLFVETLWVTILHQNIKQAWNSRVEYQWLWTDVSFALQWRHNGRDSVLNHQPHDCLLNSLFRRRSKKTSKFSVTGLCVGNSPGTGEFPAQMASYAENVSIWWRYHGMSCVVTKTYLTHRGRDKIANISLTTFSKAFSCMKMYEFRLRFHWSLFLSF